MDEPATAVRPGLRGRAVVVLVLGAGALLGTADFLVQQTRSAS